MIVNCGPRKGSSEPTPTPVNAAVYAMDIAVAESDPYERCSYPATVTYGGVEYVNACADYTPASGTELNSWADDYDSGTGLISGIVPGTLDSDGVFSEASDKTITPAGDGTHDAVTLFPTWYLSMTNDGETIRVAFSNIQLDDTFRDYAGSIGTTRYGRFCLGTYFCVYDGTCMRSYAGGTMAYSTTIGDTVARCQAREGWDLVTYPQYTYIGALMAIMWRSTDLQGAFAYGWFESDAQKSYMEAMSTTQYGMAGTAGDYSSAFNAGHMAFFWLKDLWGYVCTWCAAYCDSSRHLRWNTGMSVASDDGDDYDMDVETGVASSISGYIKEVVGSTDGGFFPSSTSGASATTYFSDYGYVRASRFPYVWGYAYAGSSSAYAGPFRAYFYYSASNTGTYIAGRPSYRM